MNTKQVLIALAVAAAMSATAVMAQSTPPATPAATAAAPADQGAPKARRHKMSFEEHKAKAVERTEKKLACLKAAKDTDAMKACTARKGKGGWHKHGGKGGAAKSDEGAASAPAAAPAPAEQ